VPASLKKTWCADLLRNYASVGSVDRLEKSFDMAVEFANRRKVPVFCGEYGVFKPNAPKADRVRWYEIVTGFMERRRIPRTSWDYRGGFGVFQDDLETEFNVELLRVMRFTPQKIVKTPINLDGLAIHADFFPPGATAGAWGGNTSIDFYDTDGVVSSFAIRWANAPRYGAFWIRFREPLDLTKQVRDGYALQFLARTRDDVQFDARFLNPDPLPWRMQFTVTREILPPDGDWHLLRFQLSMMRDVGAWVHKEAKWLPSNHNFSWANVAQLHFVPEERDMIGKTVQFDSILLVK
jgi:endoglucanase